MNRVDFLTHVAFRFKFRIQWNFSEYVSLIKAAKSFINGTISGSGVGRCQKVCVCVCVCGGGGGGTQTNNLCTFGKEPI